MENFARTGLEMDIEELLETLIGVGIGNCCRMGLVRSLA